MNTRGWVFPSREPEEVTEFVGQRPGASLKVEGRGRVRAPSQQLRLASGEKVSERKPTPGLFNRGLQLFCLRNRLGIGRVGAEREG